MTYNGVFYDFGCIMETYLYQTYQEQSIFQQKKQEKYTKLWRFVIKLILGASAISHVMALSWPRGQILSLSYLLFIKLIIHHTMVLSGTLHYLRWNALR